MSADNLDGQFAQRLTAVRLAYGSVTGRPGLPRFEFATELGMEKETYCTYERGQRVPRFAFLVAVRHLTGISLDYLIADLDQGFMHPDELRLAECTATFAERIRWVRELVEDDIGEVAKAFGVSIETYRRWEDGREPMPDTKQAEFAHRFSVSMSYLQKGQPDGVASSVLGPLRKAHPELWRAAGSRTATGADTTAPAAEAVGGPPEAPPRILPDHN
jgi:transcriptional regulator with XRE-family HTH domain